MQVTTYFDENNKQIKAWQPGCRVRVQTFFHDERGEPLDADHASQTQQQFAEQCDVNYIMKTYAKTGEITHLARQEGVYADVSTIPDLQQSINNVKAAEEAFMTLPADLRKKLDHSPVKFIQYLNDPKNDEEAIKYGLKNPPAINNDDLTTMNAAGTKTPTKQKTPPVSKYDSAGSSGE